VRPRMTRTARPEKRCRQAPDPEWERVALALPESVFVMVIHATLVGQ
jgi:hypothetical protein